MVDRKKRYFWLQLKEDFFDDDTMAYIEEQPNGKEYALIYLKMCLKSLKLDGYLKRVVGNTMIPYDIPTLSKLVNSNVDTVRVAMKMFEQIGLVKTFESGEIYMSQIEEMIGSETEAAKQKRIERAKKDVATLSHEGRNNVAQSIEKEKELNTEKEIDINNGIDNKKNAYKTVVGMFENNGFGLIGGIVATNINNELEDFVQNNDYEEASKVISKAIEIAVNRGKNNFGYVWGITKNWYQKKLFTVSAIEATERKNSSDKKEMDNYKKKQDSLEKQSKISDRLKDFEKVIQIYTEYFGLEKLPEYMRDTPNADNDEAWELLLSGDKKTYKKLKGIVDSHV